MRLGLRPLKRALEALFKKRRSSLMTFACGEASSNSPVDTLSTFNFALSTSVVFRLLAAVVRVAQHGFQLFVLRRALMFTGD